MSDKKELATTSSEVELAPSLAASVEVEKRNRDIIKQFVSDQLVDGTDYGIIVGNKPTLLKPGMEKIFSLMHLTSSLSKDTETYDMLGSTPGLVCYKATLYRDGSVQPVAEGRGAAKVGEKSRDANATIKIAEKRARMDACLSLGFSEFFTQDLEDSAPGSPPPGVNTETGEISRPPDRPASDKQKDFVHNLLKQKAGVQTLGDAARIFEQYGVKAQQLSELTMTDAKMLIDTLLQLPSIPQEDEYDNYREDEMY